MACFNKNSNLYKFCEKNGLSSPDLYDEILKGTEGMDDTQAVNYVQKLIDDNIFFHIPRIDGSLREDAFDRSVKKTKFYHDTSLRDSDYNLVSDSIKESVNNIIPKNDSMIDITDPFYQRVGSDSDEKAQFFKTKHGLPLHISSIIKIKEGRKKITLRDPEKNGSRGSSIIQYLSGIKDESGNYAPNFIGKFKSPMEISDSSSTKGRKIPVAMTLDEYIRYKKKNGFVKYTYQDALNEFIGNRDGFRYKDSPDAGISQLKEKHVKEWFTNPSSKRLILYEISDVSDLSENYGNADALSNQDDIEKDKEKLQKIFSDSDVLFQITRYNIPGSMPAYRIRAILDHLKGKFGLDYFIDPNLSDSEGNPVAGMFSSVSNTIYVNPNYLTEDTLFHEYIHPFIELVKTNNPVLFDSLKSELLLHHKGIINSTIRRYPQFASHGNTSLNDAGIEEAIVETLGRMASGEFNEFYEVDETSGAIKESKGISAKLKELMRYLLNEIGKYFKSLQNDPTVNIEVSQIPVMSLKQVSQLIGVFNNKVNINGAISLSIPSDKREQLNSVINRVDRNITALTNHYAKRGIRDNFSVSSSANLLKKEFASTSILKGFITAAYTGSSIMTNVIDKYKREYGSMNNDQKIEFMREAVLVLDSFEPLMSFDPSVLNGLNFVGKSALIGKINSIKILGSQVNSIVTSNRKTVITEFLKPFQTQGEAGQFSITSELDQAADLGMVEYLLGAEASSPDYISGLVNRVYTTSLHEDTNILKVDVEGFKNAYDELTKAGITVESVITDEDSNGNMIPYFLTPIDRGYYKKHDEYYEKMLDHRGRLQTFKEGDSPEDLAFNVDLNSKIKNYGSFLKKNTMVDPDININVSGVDMPLADFFMNVFGLDQDTGLLEIHRGFDVVDVHKILDKYFKPNIRKILSSTGKIIGEKRSIEYDSNGHKIYDYDTFSLRGEYRIPDQDLWSNKKMVKVLSNPVTAQFYMEYENLHRKYLSVLPQNMYNKNTLPVAENTLSKSFLSSDDKSAFIGSKFAEIKSAGINNMTKSSSSSGSNPGIPLYFRTKKLDKRNEKLASLEKSLEAEKDPEKQQKLQEEIAYISSHIDFNDIDYSSVGDSFIKFMQMSHEYNRKVKIESALLLTREILEDREVYSKSTLTDNAKTTLDGKIKVKPITSTNRVSQRYNEWLDGVFYKAAEYDDDSMMAFIGDKLIKYSSIVGIGINPKASFFNLAMGHMNNLVESVGGLFYNSQDLAKAKLEYNQNVLEFSQKGESRTDIAVIIDDISVFEPNGLDGRFRGLDSKKFSDLMKSDKLFLLDNIAEHAVQTQVTIAMMNSHRVDQDGDILSFSDFKKKYSSESLKSDFENLPTLRNSFKVDSGKLNTSNINPVQLELWRQRTKGIIQLTHGRYNSEDAAWIQRYFWGRAILQFKKWVGSTVEERFKAGYYDVRLRENIEGRYRSFGRFLLSKVMQYAKAESDAINWSSLSEMERANIWKTGMDMVIIGGTTLTASLLMGVMKSMKNAGDDDSVEYATINFLRYSMLRIRQETSSLVNPMEWKTFYSNPVASMRIIKDLSEAVTISVEAVFSDEELVYQRGPNKGVSKVQKETLDLVPGYSFYRFVKSLFYNPTDYYIK